jgi:cytochrome c-type biogenesis protein CcmE
LTLAGLVAAAIGGLVYFDSGEGVLEYVYANEVASSPERFVDREFRVHGLVAEGSVKQKKGGAGDYTFDIVYEGETLSVHYADMVPDTFAEGGEVVLTGTLENGRFEATEMSAKCPSKYEEKDDPTKNPARS